MYLPKHFEVSDSDRVQRLIRENPFATLASVGGGDLRGDAHGDLRGNMMISHFPLIIGAESLEPDAKALKLLGHMSRHNPHHTALSDGESVTVVFHGPSAYITPTWYGENDVPTWNYAVVHATGRLRWIPGYEALVVLLKQTTAVFEGSGEGAWRFLIPDDLQGEATLTGAIIGFEIEVDSLQAKFKLNQNRSRGDREGVIAGLGARSDEGSRKVRDLMLETLGEA